MHGRISPLLIALLLFCASPATAEPRGASLLTDLSPWPRADEPFDQGGGGAPYQLVAVGDRVFFSANTAGAGRELWVSDGSRGGARLVADLYAGNGSSNPNFLTTIGDQVIFRASDETGNALWLSDGTARGTRRVAPAHVAKRGNFNVDNIVVDGSCAWMRGHDGITGAEPWRYCLSDDTLVQLADLAPGIESSHPEGFHVAAGRVYFNTSVGLFVSDAHADTLKPFSPPGAPDLRLGYGDFTLYRGQYYFAGTTAANGTELWRTDGTLAGTQLAVDSMPGPASGNPYGLIVLDDALYFSAATPLDGHELRVSDGTSAGTRLVLDINRGPGSAGILFTFEDNGSLLFAATDETATTTLWRTDGTAAGTRWFSSPAGIDLTPMVFGYTALADRVVFFAQSVQYGLELWGTADGDSIELIKDINPGPSESIFDPSARLGDQLIFGALSPDTGLELWRSKGTTRTTQLLDNLRQDDSADSAFYLPLASGENIFFSGPGEMPVDRAVWSTDGTSAGTRRVRNFRGSVDAYGYPVRPNVGGFLELDPGLTFFASSPDPRQSGQWVVREGLVERIGEQRLLNPVRVGGWIISRTDDGNLWSTTGEKGSLEQVAQISDTGALWTVPFIEVAADLAWFFSAPPEQGLTLWRSDGTAQGTQVARADLPGSSNTDFRILGPLGEALLFLARGDGITLWRADRSGIVPLRSVGGYWPNYGVGFDRGAAIADRLVFTSDISNSRNQLWTTDGTNEGTVQLVTEADVPGFRPDPHPVAFDAHAYFVARDAQRGTTLWRTDGTREGTAFFADVEPGIDELDIHSLVVHDGQLYFVAVTRASGNEIWKTDGKKLTQVTELLPGSLSAAPWRLQSVGDVLIFRADDGVHGVEPWVIH